MKVVAIVVLIVVVAIVLVAVTCGVWRWLSDSLWVRAREDALWYYRSRVQPNGDIRVVVQQEAHVGWSVEVLGDPVTVETVAKADVESGLLQSAIARADILAGEYNKTI